MINKLVIVTIGADFVLEVMRQSSNELQEKTSRKNTRCSSCVEAIKYIHNLLKIKLSRHPIF